MVGIIERIFILLLGIGAVACLFNSIDKQDVYLLGLGCFLFLFACYLILVNLIPKKED